MRRIGCGLACRVPRNTQWNIRGNGPFEPDHSIQYSMKYDEMECRHENETFVLRRCGRGTGSGCWCGGHRCGIVAYENLFINSAAELRDESTRQRQRDKQGGGSAAGAMRAAGYEQV